MLDIGIKQKKNLELLVLAILGLAQLPMIGPTVQKLLAVNFVLEWLTVGLVVGAMALFGAYLIYRQRL